MAPRGWGIACTTVAWCLAMVLAGASQDRLTSIPGYPPFLSANYAGYLPALDSRIAFYWLVESENNPATDPVIFWFNGGPGCSSLEGLFTEIGPYRLVNNDEWARDPFAWTTNFSVVFIDSPGGVGFSPDLPGVQTAWNDTYVAALNYATLRSFYSTHPRFGGLPFYVSGESYAGHYVPQLVNEILLGPDQAMLASIKGLMVGNPCTGNFDGTNIDLCFVFDDPTLDEYTQTHALTALDPRIPNAPFDDTGSGSDSSSTPYDPYDYLVRVCGGASPQAARLLSRRFKGGSYDPCALDYAATWLQRPEVRAALGVKPGMVWADCAADASFTYPTPYNATPGVVPLYRYFMDNTQLDILIWSGTADTVVNFIQTERILLSLGRSVVSDFTPWFYTDVYNSSWQQLGGYYILWDRISWASIRGAGHEVPSTQPAPMKQLLMSFVFTGRPGAAIVNGTFTTVQTSPWSMSGAEIGAAAGVSALGLGLGYIVVWLITLPQRRRITRSAAPEVDERSLVDLN